MTPLSSDLRHDLERAVVRAREIAEEGARASLAVLGLEALAAPVGLQPADRDLRMALRARGRSIGSGDLALGVDGLVEEVAYEQWHRMLFARFLAENGLLIHPGGAPVSMAEVAELAAEEGERDEWTLAARYASAMLPGIFRADDPAHQVRFAPEHRTGLESVLAGLPAEVFTADDALGWVYQFWQAKRKKEVNDSGRKIGGADLPPVTQLFTEHYMVRFLLENSLGAWWAGRHPDSPLLREWEYLRFRDDGTPAAGTFEGWPARVAEVTAMDPCCGSGHFITAASDMLRRMRQEEEGLTAAEAAIAVLRDNVFGLELDARCLQLAAFNLALDAWKAGGYQPLPVPNLACTGIAIKGQRADWGRLAGGDANMAGALDRLYDLFQDAPELGSLIDPRSTAGEGLWAVDVDHLLGKLDQALQREASADPAAAVFGAAAAGTAKAAQLLARRYWLVATNPPFLSRGKQSVAKGFADRRYPDSRANLATMFLERAAELSEASGATALVTPQGWFFMGAYRALRRRVLASSKVLLLGVLGAGAFDAISGEVVNVALVVTSTSSPEIGHQIRGVDATLGRAAFAKAVALRSNPLLALTQSAALATEDARIGLDAIEVRPLLRIHADSVLGLGTGDFAKYGRSFWEVRLPSDQWRLYQTSVQATAEFGGRSQAVRWDRQRERIGGMSEAERAQIHNQDRSGAAAWGRRGVAVALMGSLPATLYSGLPYDKSSAVLVPKEEGALAALWAFVSSPEFSMAVRRVDKNVIVANGSLVKVPFDLEDWTRVAAEQYPDGLPEPRIDDPTQWLFKGNVAGSEAPLQVAVARLLGYRWPDQQPDELDDLADGDGIVPLPSVIGEAPAHERLRVLLAHAYGPDWSPALLDRLLVGIGSPGATLESWLRDDFFAQHVRLFASRPFIWQVWDGRKDGFSALLHYRRLDARALEKLTYTYLNDWIERQRARREEPAAEARLVAALGLQDKLKLILEGEPPYDIYVRWKPLETQPVGWDPDMDDGVRLNIRPFVTAGILRTRLSINWKKDRGANPDGTERLNDHHFTRAQKLAAQDGTS